MASTRVLVVDDEPGGADLVAARLERSAVCGEAVATRDPHEALETVREGAVDCVVSDYRMPRLDGLELFEAVRESDPELPFVLYTARDDPAFERRATEAGVTACLRKDGGRDHYRRMVEAIRRATGRSETDAAAPESDR